MSDGVHLLRLSIAAAACAAVASCSEGGAPSAPPPAAPAPAAANLAPVAEAAGPARVVEGGAATLSGGQSRDPDGAIASYAWRQTSGPAVTLFGADTPDARFSAPLVAGAGEAVFELTVTDEESASATATIAVDLDPAPLGSVVEIETRFDDVARAYSVYTPARYQPGDPAVLLLHGGGGSMREVFRPVATTARWLELADADGFLVIAPNGFNETSMDGLGDQQSWNDLRNDLSGRTSLQDDAGFILETLDAVEAARGHDADRVLATGASNGGMMTFRLLIEFPERFFAGAAFIAALPEETIRDPLSATPVMLLNGSEDQLVLFDGGPVAGDGAPTRSVPDTIAYWLDNNAADTAAAVVSTLPDQDPGDGCELIETRYPSLIGGATAVLVYDAQGGGHNTPDPDAPDFATANEVLLGPRCRDANGVDLAYDFFKAL
ncbi:MAG: hypothetical protein AAFX03_09825 [Pseudomonadota bacterium]